MKQRTYHREELNSTEEIVQEFQALRDEVCVELASLNERIDKKPKKPPKK